MKKYLSKFVLPVTLLFQICFIFYSNYTRLPIVMDHDCAKLMYHALRMWEDKKIFLDSWNYMTTLELDCSSLIAIPIYGLTHNYLFSFSLANTIITIIYTAIIYAIMRGCKLSANLSFLGCLLVLIPYSYGMLEYYNMMFFGGGQYSIKVLIVLLLLYIFVIGTNSFFSIKSWRTWCIGICSLVLIFVCAMSSGIYIIVVALFPMGLATLFIEFLKKRTIVGYKMSKYKFMYIIIATMGAMFGLAINIFMDVSASGNSFRLVNANLLTTNILATLDNLAALLGALPRYSSLRVISIIGIIHLVRFVFMVIFLVAVISTFKKVLIGIYSDNALPFFLCERFILSVYIIFIVSINLLILFVTQSGPISRYMLIFIVPSFLLIVLFIQDIYSKIRQYKSYFQTAIAIFVISILLSSDYQVYYNNVFPTDTVGNNRNLQVLLTKLVEYPDTEIYFLNRTFEAELLRIYDYGSSREYLTYIPSEERLDIRDYYNKKIEEMDPEHLLIVNTVEEDIHSIPTDVLVQYQLIDQTDCFDIYSALPLN